MTGQLLHHRQLPAPALPRLLGGGGSGVHRRASVAAGGSRHPVRCTGLPAELDQPPGPPQRRAVGSYSTVHQRLALRARHALQLRRTRRSVRDQRRGRPERGPGRVHEAYREFAQYWLAGDELRAGRADGTSGTARPVSSCSDRSSACTRRRPRGRTSRTSNCRSSTPTTPRRFSAAACRSTCRTHAYAHWLLLYRLLKGAGSGRCRPTWTSTRWGAPRSCPAFVDEVKRGDAHAFFVKSTKYQTIDERRDILAQSRREFATPSARRSPRLSAGIGGRSRGA